LGTGKVILRNRGAGSKSRKANWRDPIEQMKERKSEFEKAAAEYTQEGFLRELWGFLRHNKKWWLVPILIMLLIFGLLVVLSGTGLAPFIYTLF